MGIVTFVDETTEGERRTAWGPWPNSPGGPPM
ncbi:hypothetical protein HDC93_004360 [Streptomyces sp. AK010]|nr:hypothetical protein [Streptomyces sp. AK010]